MLSVCLFANCLPASGGLWRCTASRIARMCSYSCEGTRPKDGESLQCSVGLLLAFWFAFSSNTGGRSFDYIHAEASRSSFRFLLAESKGINLRLARHQQPRSRYKLRPAKIIWSIVHRKICGCYFALRKQPKLYHCPA